MPTPQGKECGQAEVGTPEGGMEGLLKSWGGGNDSTIAEKAPK